MEFAKEQVVQTMRAAFNNLYRVVEYLVTRMPTEMEQISPPRAKPIMEMANPQPKMAKILMQCKLIPMCKYWIHLVELKRGLVLVTSLHLG